MVENPEDRQEGNEDPDAKEKLAIAQGLSVEEFRQAIEMYLKKVTLPPELENLTSRQREVAQLVLRGWSSAEIALHLGIASQTVRHTFKTACLRVGVNSRPDFREKYWDFLS